MKIFNDLLLKFEKPDWSANPEFCVIDTILESRPDIILMLKPDIIGKERASTFGRKDTPSVEQIVRAAIFKEMRGMDYRELEYAQNDSRICEAFIKLDGREPYTFQMFQKYISRIKPESLHRVLVEINKIAISEGLEDVKSVSQDSTVVKTNIHYPTNNSLVWDCVKTSTRLLAQLKEEIDTLDFIDYTKSAKKTFYEINITRKEANRIPLFHKQLILFTKVINQTSNAIKKKSTSFIAMGIQAELAKLRDLMDQVYDVTYRKEIDGEKVPNEDKLFSIYEQHTDIIVKGQREALFGHKINLAAGKSNLVLDCQVLRGNPADKSLFKTTIDNVIQNYEIIPRDSATDGGYASKANLEYAQEAGITNIVFNKVVGSMQNIVSSLNMETRLKKWRSAMEAIISNIKRGFNIFTCNWKGWIHFQAKVLWSVLAYNFRVMTGLILDRLKPALLAS
ncbi:MAG: ISNCY family transposase [Ignavibacteriales bacterium]|nr:MAG: ISNCY family transposase [Ignavibacteriales bacterium]